MSIAKIPSLLIRTSPSLTWEGPEDKREVFLTFDDGPTPGITPWVLDLLEEAGAKATFFCLGRNVDKYPELYNQILEGGHSTGNHTYSHLKGYRYSIESYLDDIRLASQLIDSNLFRPPYGRILPWQTRKIRKEFKIVMWSLLSVDYNRKLSPARVRDNVIKNVKPGSIIVFHDSIKAGENLRQALPEVLAFLKKEGYSMQAIPMMKSGA